MAKCNQLAHLPVKGLTTAQQTHESSLRCNSGSARRSGHVGDLLAAIKHERRAH